MEGSLEKIEIGVCVSGVVKEKLPQSDSRLSHLLCGKQRVRSVQMDCLRCWSNTSG